MRAANEALIVIDVQNDFCPNGALAVRDGDAIVGSINAMLPDFTARILTQDWHPIGHTSFASSYDGKSPYDLIDMSYGPQILWPDHCVQNTHGAAFHDVLETGSADLIIRKGFRPQIDSYSAFFENDKTTPTGLEGYLRTRGLDTVTIVGLATDFCVAYSALDAARLGFKVTVDMTACRGIDLNGSLDVTLTQMHAAGVKLKHD
ncbi:bifunctional nicotinamidase/pyrazinamidase [Brumicola pallidula]|jgi:nicotinamidase/pyrazinamidase|uniref:Nicotinamidase n=1 Tax=Brumicola pallidula DSM 14239 = ACAM 615 TaxID=1121922 RepID=K6Z9I1_9ALTE|nr:bifunctional nicotinamidase/pyrazinamidase [Glaciecola pallidula]GAC27042.1 nicotinamidase/pyrazinamidase [Glaciecola pallidula DSM 14239 = ACAM 615]